MPQNFSASQLRAARGLLNWTRAQLAEISGVSEPTIQRMETGGTTPHGKSVSSIIRAFDDNGVEFTENFGVRQKPRSFDIYEGSENFKKFMDDIYEVAKLRSTEICIFGVDEKLFIEHLGQDFCNIHIQRMAALKAAKVRCLIREGDSNVYCDSYNDYKWVPHELFSSVPFYVYGNKFAVVLFENSNVMVVVMDSEPISKAYRKQFDVFWKMSRKPELSQISKSR